MNNLPDEYLLNKLQHNLQHNNNNNNNNIQENIEEDGKSEAYSEDYSNNYSAKSKSNKIKIKICGITRESDLKYIENQGADYIGFINVKRSPRFQSFDQIQKLLDALGDKDKAVLVLESETGNRINRSNQHNQKDEISNQFSTNSIVDEIFNKILKSKKIGIKNFQIHSIDLESFKDLQNKVNDPEINLIRVIGLSEENRDSKENNNPEIKKKQEIISSAKISDGILFDYQIKGKSGGTGRQIPFDLVINAAKIAKDSNKDINLFLAGGMDINLINDEKNIIQFFDVIDFNSSLEDSPGIKNKDKIKELMELIG